MSLRVEAGFEHFKDAMGRVLAEQIEFPPGILVTVLGAKITANTAHAKIILSVFPQTAEKEVRQILHDYDHEIKEGLVEHLRLRRVPQLHYTFDETEAQASGIEQTIQELKEKGEID